MRFSTYCTRRHTFTHIWRYTYIYRHSLSGCAEFSTRNKRIRSISQRAPQANRPRKKNRIEPNGTEPNRRRTRKQTAQTAEKRPNSPTFSHRLTAPKNLTELNRTRKRKFRTQCAAQCAMRSETDKPTSRRA